MSHMGISCFDLPKMVAFYTEVLCMTVSDRGQIPAPINSELVFLTTDASEHHQLVLAAGRTEGDIADAPPFGGSWGSSIFQLSFRVDGFAGMRQMRDRLRDAVCTHFIAVNHGNAWSLYSRDLEGNALEFVVDSPWYTAQPCGAPFDRDADDSDILRETEELEPDPLHVVDDGSWVALPIHDMSRLVHPLLALNSDGVPGMRLVTIRTADGTSAGRVEGDTVVPLPFGDVGELLASGDDWAITAAGAGSGATIALTDADLAPVVTRPSKIWCVGLNYLLHVKEGGAEVPQYPTLFAKFADALCGPNDDIVIPKASTQIDWEVELVAVIGKTVRNATEAEAIAAVAGFAVGNDVSMRDWQMRTSQFLQGKTWEAASPVGPWMVTTDEVGGARPDLAIQCLLDDEVMQEDRTSNMLFDAVHVVQYVSTIMTLRPGDLIFTGTPSGVGLVRTPPVLVQPGQSITCRVEGIGEFTNRFVAEA